jgi:hypothetical protein
MLEEDMEDEEGDDPLVKFMMDYDYEPEGDYDGAGESYSDEPDRDN